MRLRRYIPPAPAARTGARALTIEPGQINPQGQKVLRRAGRATEDLPGQSVYVLECTRCSHTYGTPGIRVHGRTCPHCGGGKPGLSVPGQEPTLFG